MAVTRSRHFRNGAHALTVATAAFALVAAATPVRADTDGRITVMTRNLYLGADVGPAMTLLPNLSAAATFMWQQVHQTDFSLRSAAIAREVAAAAPDVLGLQEATVWSCAPHAWSRPVPVYDFTAMLQSALAAQGLVYTIASGGGSTAVNPGFTIGPIPGLTVVHDPEVFRPLFGTDAAACGFRIADALLVRQGVTVDRAGTSEYVDKYTIVPLVMTVHRGYAWADVRVGAATARVVTTHLESMADVGKVPTAKHQADQLVADLAATSGPLIVVGDFNSDPRDPRAPGAPNPGEQPVSTAACPAQDGHDATCSPYWTMRAAGYVDAGPDATTHMSWGFDALLDGPSPSRPQGMTDRLDYVFTRGGVGTVSTALVDDSFPTSESWQCGTAMCAPSDHAGLVVTLELPEGTAVHGVAPPMHAPGLIGPGRTVLLAGAGATALMVRRRRARRAARSRATQDPTG